MFLRICLYICIRYAYTKMILTNVFSFYYIDSGMQPSYANSKMCVWKILTINLCSLWYLLLRRRNELFDKGTRSLLNFAHWLSKSPTFDVRFMPAVAFELQGQIAAMCVWHSWKTTVLQTHIQHVGYLFILVIDRDPWPPMAGMSVKIIVDQLQLCWGNIGKIMATNRIVPTTK